MCFLLDFAEAEEQEQYQNNNNNDDNNINSYTFPQAIWKQKKSRGAQKQQQSDKHNITDWQLFHAQSLPLGLHVSSLAMNMYCYSSHSTHHVLYLETERNK